MIRHFSSIPKPLSAPSPSVNFDGTWKNELTSDMTIQVTAGRVTGKYRTGVGSPSPTEAFDLVGFAADDQISFTVDFSKYGTLTSWVGQHTINKDGKEIIKTMWLLSKNVADPDEPKKLWGSVLTGCDTFFR